MEYWTLPLTPLPKRVSRHTTRSAPTFSRPTKAEVAHPHPGSTGKKGERGFGQNPPMKGIWGVSGIQIRIKGKIFLNVFSSFTFFQKIVKKKLVNK